MVHVERMLDDWLDKARHINSLGPDEMWPAWSTGECLAVALILRDWEELAALEYTEVEALQRLSFDIGVDLEGAVAVFRNLREQL